MTTLNASSITGGSISAQGNLTFTGANTLNGVTLDATDRTVTVGTGNSDSLTVGGTSSTLNIGTLDGTIKTAAGVTLTGSTITGGGANGGTITALGDLTFAGKNFLNDGVTLNAAGKTVTVDTLWVEGTSTLNIGTLNGVIRTNVATTFSNSTISGGDGGLYIYENTDVTFAGENQVNAACWWTSYGHYSSIINGNNGLITVKSIPASGDNPNALDYVPAQRGVLKTVDIWNNGIITVGSADAENADACSIEVTNLTNNNNLTVACIAKSANPSRLKATQGIVNNGMMTLTNSELTANTLTNNGSGISQSTAGMTISNSTVSASGENPLVITNGAANNTSATIEFNNSTVTAGQVTNFSFHNGQDPTWGTWGLVVTNQSFFSVTDLSNTGWIQVTDSTLSATSVYIGEIDNERNYSGKLQVNGTSTLDIASLEGTITIGSGNFPDPITLTGSTITGKVDNGDRLGKISVTNPLTFTGTNTLTNISLATTNCGAVTVGDSDPEADSLTLTNSTVGCTVKVQSGATLTLDGMNTITTLDLSEATGVVMDWQDQLSFTGFSGDYEGKLTINLNNFTAGDLSKPILDYTGDTVLTDAEAMYRALLNNETTPWASSEGDPIQYSFYVDENTCDLCINISQIVVDGGTYDTTTVLNGVPTEIGETPGKTTLFEKGVFGGGDTTEAAGTAETPVEQGIDLSVSGGTFAKFVAGGSFVDLAKADDEYYVSGDTQTVSISGGIIKSTVAGGDRLQKGVMHRVGDLDMEITGGTFTAFVSGGMMNILTDTQSGHAYIDGDIELEITGGTFTDNCWIYGGNVSSNKATISANSTINGSVTITVDAAGVANAGIVLSHIIVGSHGNGHIEGKIQADESLLGTKIVFLGDGGNDGVDDGSAVVFAKNNDNEIVGELWGSSSGDVLNPITKKINSSVVKGDRVLSFMGFKGQLDCANIRAFSKIEIKNNLSGVEKWEIDCGSTLSGNFISNLAGDTLNLIGFADITTPQTLMTDTDKSDDVAGGNVETARNIFNGFGGLTIKMNGKGVSSAEFSNDTWTFAAGGSNYSLALVASEASTSMILTRTPLIA